MKRLFLLLALMGIVATGCSKDGGGSENNIPENIFFGLDKERVTISPDGGSVDVIVYSNYNWEISGTSDWCTPSVKGGDANEDGQKVTFSADVAYDDREATFWFRCADEQIKFVVSQKLKEVIIPDANNTFNIPAEGGVAVISYQTSVDCEVIIPEEAQDWITIAPATRGLISKSSTLYIAENITYSARTAVVKVVAKDNAELVVEYTINQEQNDAVLAYGNTEFTISGREQQITIKHKANVNCDVVIPDEAQDWVAIAPATRGLSTYSTTLNIAENNSGKERSCVIKVTSQGENELSAEYAIIQNPRYCIYYTSRNGMIVQPYDSSAFGATILSNTYIDGIGAIDFNAPITTIGNSAFRNCDSLTSVTIPDSVTTIGYSAFYNCDSLQEFNGKFASEDGRCLIIDGVLNSFAIGCGATEYTIPDSVTTIGLGAFSGCSSLTSVTIPDSVTTIGSSAFNGCSSLTSVTIPDSVTTIGSSAFNGCTGELIINSKIVETDYTYNNYPSYYGWLKEAKFTKLTIGDSVTSIGNYAFEDCSSLTSVTIGNSVTTIGEYAFEDCSSLTSVYISDIAAWCDITFSSLVSNPLCYASNLYLNNELVTDLVIPDSVTSIGDYAFPGCSSLTSVTIGDSVTTIGGMAFYYCDSLTSVTIPDSVTTIGDVAFSGCSSLQEFNGKFASEDDRCLIIDGTLNSFAPAGLTEYTIPDSVTSIGYEAFYDCDSLTSVTIPDSVTKIGGSAFQYCSSLTSVYCKAITPPVALISWDYWYTFSGNAPNRKIYVPMESVEAYKSASHWKNYADAIEGYEF